MLKFLIVQFVKGDAGKNIPTRKIDWSEEQILQSMKLHMPVHTHPALEKAWKKTLDTFKGLSVNVK